jgi:hypothetical protein
MGIAIGQILTETYVPVEVKTCHDLLNTITPVRLTSLASHLVEAVVLINATTNLQIYNSKLWLAVSFFDVPRSIFNRVWEYYHPPVFFSLVQNIAFLF